MKVKRFIGSNMQLALRQVSRELGEDAVILSTKKVAEGFEVVAALDYQSDAAAQHNAEVDRQLQLQQELERAKALQQQRREAIARGETPREIDLDRDIRGELPDMTYQRPQSARAARPAERQNISQRADQGVNKSAAAPTMAAATASSEQTDYSELLAKMSGELQELKNWMVSHGGSAWDSGRPMTWQQSQLWNRCQDVGLEPAWADKIVARVQPSDNIEEAWKQAMRQIAMELPVVKSGSLDKGGVFALVGPTGAGKTTTIGKLAARFVMHNGADSVALVSIDSYRMAAQDQLRSVARILGVQLHSVTPGNDLAPLLDQLVGKEKKRLVLIDTAGLASQDPAFPQQLSMLKQASECQVKAARLRCLLTLPLTSQGRCLQENYEHYKEAGLAGCIFTKLDECFSLGPAMSVAALTRMPVVMVADGPRIPDDLHYPDAGKLVKLAEQMARMARTRWQAADAMRSPARQAGSQHGVQ
ncbi:flagellar biosynthesis protein FlhF [Oceanobacter mangrovi]|uniref:flagellar biosynthesis protein FlhF n=1 Tax=Oceanobacter mangrovi TaxID=2862510 RepID=UPI001C8F039B|nr:flagellar biosynthesis protein FlhF [Oceanobacter mangrovi]